MTSAGPRAIDRLDQSIAALEPMADPSYGAGRDFSQPSTTLLLMFAGAAPWPQIPRWVLYTQTSDLPVKRLFMRDVHSIWYQRGVPGFGESVDEVAGSLRAFIDHHEIERLVVAGPSSGGYAALVFGTLLEADVVLAFSPQTFVSRSEFHAVGDHRWDSLLERLDRFGGPDERYADVPAAIARAPRGDTRCQVHFGSSDHFDALHANRLAGAPGVELYPHDHDGHTLMRALRDSGDLKQIVRDALAV